MARQRGVAGPRQTKVAPVQFGGQPGLWQDWRPPELASDQELFEYVVNQARRYAAPTDQNQLAWYLARQDPTRWATYAQALEGAPTQGFPGPQQAPPTVYGDLSQYLSPQRLAAAISGLSQQALGATAPRLAPGSTGGPGGARRGLSWLQDYLRHANIGMGVGTQRQTRAEVARAQQRMQALEQEAQADPDLQRYVGVAQTLVNPTGQQRPGQTPPPIGGARLTTPPKTGRNVAFL